MTTLYLDTETTGLHGAEMVECAIIDDDGRTVLDTLVNPGRPIPPDASRIHGITDDMVKLAPPADAVRAFVLELVRHRPLVIYNAAYDVQFFPGIHASAAAIHCAMLDYAPHYGDWNEYHQSWRWARLGAAADRCGHVADGPLHRARADTLACRTVWHWLQARQTEPAS
jgi:DNA polymerase III epsilon subunit-like protein